MKELRNEHRDMVDNNTDRGLVDLDINFNWSGDIMSEYTNADEGDYSIIYINDKGQSFRYNEVIDILQAELEKFKGMTFWDNEKTIVKLEKDLNLSNLKLGATRAKYADLGKRYRELEANNKLLMGQLTFNEDQRK